MEGKIVEQRLERLCEEQQRLKNELVLGESFWHNQEVLIKKRNLEFAISELKFILERIKVCSQKHKRN